MRLPSVRGRIVDNLVLGRPWYIDLSVPMIWNLEEAERERKKVGKPVVPAWFQAVCYQRSKLMRLIAEDDMWDTEAEKVFVQAFWETLDSLYAQEADAARRGGSASVEKRWERLEGELYRSITQAKARAPFRSAVSRWFAKAGRQKSIGAHSAAVWRLIDQEWSKGRDLALLALASHRNKETRESVTTTEQGA
jgi:CRISPR-associated protein Cas8a1/Csx13